MDQLEFFRHTIRILHGSGLRYMVVGSFASGFWGEPRATYDVDVLISLSKLLYYREGGSEKHLRDIAGIIKLRKSELDADYLIRWSAELRVEQEWITAQSWRT